MKRKLFSLLLAMILVLTAVPITAFAEDEDIDVGIGSMYEVRLSVENITVGNDDETVEISVTAEKNSGFAGMNYQLVFDDSVLSLESDPVLGEIEGLELVSGPLEGGKHLTMITSKNGENVYGQGVLVTYTFKINPNAVAGKYNIQLIKSGVAELPGGETVKLEILDENFTEVVSYVQNGGVTVPGYIVSYDANGGNGAPESQTKSKNSFVYISSAVPTRSGYSFEGWSTNKNAVTAEYKAGDKYTANADAVLYAVWKSQTAVAGSIDIVAAKVEGKTGDEVEVAISVANNPGIGGMQFDIVFDDTRLAYKTISLVSYDEESGITLDSFMFVPPNPDAITNKIPIALVSNLANLVGDGDVIKIKFKVLEDAEDGFADISIVPVEFYKYSGTNMSNAVVVPNITNGGVGIVSQLVGDINLDETVNSDDAVLLLKHLLFGSEVYPINYKGSLDFNSDGLKNSDDAVRLLKFVLFGGDLYPIE